MRHDNVFLCEKKIRRLLIIFLIHFLINQQNFKGFWDAFWNIPFKLKKLSVIEKCFLRLFSRNLLDLIFKTVLLMIIRFSIVDFYKYFFFLILSDLVLFEALQVLQKKFFIHFLKCVWKATTSSNIFFFLRPPNVYFCRVVFKVNQSIQPFVWNAVRPSIVYFYIVVLERLNDLQTWIF